MSYIKWDAEGIEVVQPGEEDLKKHVAEQFNQLQSLQFTQTAHCYRATHLKTQGCVRGTFTINDNLPAHLAQGMFAKPGKHDCIIRYSSLPPQITPDTAHAPRGVGLKVFDVPGDKLFGGSDTQDFTFNNYKILELRDIPGSSKLADGLIKNYDDLSRFSAMEAAQNDKTIAEISGTIAPQAYMSSMPQYSQGAYRYGDYVAKFGVFPTGEEQLKLKNIEIKETDPVTILSDSLKRFHAEHTATYSFQVQLLENLKDQPVEDIGIEWDDKKYPFVEVAKLEFEPQDSFDDAFRTWFDDSGVACNPWHGLKEHQPLGGAQRVRRQVYAESRKKRLRMNGKKEYTEPKSLSEVPVSA